MADSVIRIKPSYYIHVLNNNTNVTHVIVGPKTVTRKEEEKVVLGPEPMISIPPRHFCLVQNPVMRDPETGDVQLMEGGQAMVRYGDSELRFAQDPFPLYPMEKLSGTIQPLQVVPQNSALRLKALRDFEDGATVRQAGSEWQYEGPGTYTPHVAVAVQEKITATILRENQALRLRARVDTTDRSGSRRRAGEEWLVRTPGAYLPATYEQVVGIERAHVLTDKKALHVRAIKTFTDVFGTKRRAGTEWLVTNTMAEAYIADVYEEVLGVSPIVSLSNRQYCFVLNPVNAAGVPQLGRRELRLGERSFFLQPGESLEAGIQDVYVLAEEEALLLRAVEACTDVARAVDGTQAEVQRAPGDLWMVYGPTDYVPRVEVEIVEKRKAISLAENEGVYVRDIHTGRVRAEIGQSYMLKPNEELWAKELPEVVELLLQAPGAIQVNNPPQLRAVRDKTRVVAYRAPHNSVVQIYDYGSKTARVVFGPELVMLVPEEDFTVVSLSGSKPKRPNHLKTIALQLGPEFMTDIITVETADHARLQLQLSYSWQFLIDRAGNLQEQAAKIFAVADFTGDACKSLASRIRGAVAATPFDDFHKASADIIRAAVFGVDENGEIRKSYVNRANNLCINSIDIQVIEPVDQRTRDSLQKSVQLAIEITISSQEATARHEAQSQEQESRGRLERQRIQDEADAEAQRTELLSLQANSAIVEATGQATADAKARAEAALIEGQAAVNQARLQAEAAAIESGESLTQLKERYTAETSHLQALNELETYKARALAEIEANKFGEIVGSIGRETIQSIAKAGPELQAKLLQGLGLQGYMVVDSNSPINLFQQAESMVNPAAAAAGGAAGGAAPPGL